MQILTKGTLVACRSNGVFSTFGIVNNECQTVLNRHERVEKWYFVRIIWPNQPPHEVIEEMEEQTLLPLAQDANFEDPEQIQAQIPEILLKILREKDELEKNFARLEKNFDRESNNLYRLKKDLQTLRDEGQEKDRRIKLLEKRVNAFQELASQGIDGVMV